MTFMLGTLLFYAYGCGVPPHIRGPGGGCQGRGGAARSASLMRDETAPGPLTPASTPKASGRPGRWRCKEHPESGLAAPTLGIPSSLCRCCGAGDLRQPRENLKPAQPRSEEPARVRPLLQLIDSARELVVRCGLLVDELVDLVVGRLDVLALGQLVQ